MDRLARSLALSLMVLVAVAVSGCLTTHKVGIASVSFAPQQRTALSCLGQNKGLKAELKEGEHAGKPVVTVSGIDLVFSPVLHESYEQDGAQVFVGQSCLASLRICDSLLVLRNGRWRAAVYWFQSYPAPRQLPSSSREVFDQVRDSLLPALRAIDLDALALSELETLAATWRTPSKARAALQLPGSGAGGGSGAEPSGELANLAAGVQVPADLTGSLVMYPRLAPMVLAVGLVGGGGKFPGQSGVVCVGSTGTAPAR
jgi:hypothetical protein